ncbi:hypothetical protein [Zavarzinella formosa]|uniref:hypothetical protein n=1 Tax=Zavarzinella formosa TaxID=360055 RepID=UPI0012FB150D|nr:hypothetical protein [Zavarzinella formosa]
MTIWWERLSENERLELSHLCDPRQETCFFGVVANQITDELPVVVSRNFSPNDDAWRTDEWEDDWREYLWEHAESLRMLSMCQEGSWLIGGILNVFVDWKLVDFKLTEMPPSEHRLAGCANK